MIPLSMKSDWLNERNQRRKLETKAFCYALDSSRGTCRYKENRATYTVFWKRYGAEGTASSQADQILEKFNRLNRTNRIVRSFFLATTSRPEQIELASDSNTSFMRMRHNPIALSPYH